MTRKDFVALASALAEVYPYVTVEAEFDVLVDAVVDVCRKSNPRFDRGRFINYIRERVS